MSTGVAIDSVTMFSRARAARVCSLGDAVAAATRRKADLLRSLSLFAGITDVEVFRLAEAAFVRRFERGRTLVRMDSREECAFLVEGRARSSITRGTGEFTLRILERGDIISQSCWLPRTGASIGDPVALEACCVLIVPRRSLDAFLVRNGNVALRFIEAIAAGLDRAMDFAAQNACLEVGDRLYRKLVEFCATRARPLPGGAIRIEHGLYQAELAASVGASREAVNRQFGLWREHGLVELGRKFLIVRDPLGLSMAVSRAVRELASPLSAASPS